MTENRPLTAALILIGNELLSGRTRDANLAYLGKGLEAVGIRIREVRVVPDEEDAIVEAVNALRGRHDHVFTTGGIGPTHDDITAASVAQAFGVPLHRHPEALRRLQRQYAADDLNAARLRMADVPEGAALIDNPVSQAPGFRMGNVHVLAGVPVIMRAMFDGLAPSLAGGAPVRSRTVAGFTTEGAIAAPLGAVQADHPAVEIGSYPFVRDGRFGVSLVVRGTDTAAVDDAVAAVRAVLSAAGAEPMEESDHAVA